MKKIITTILAIIMLAMLFIPAYAMSSQFTDVEANTWYSDGVDYVVREGLMRGTSDTTFNPNGTVNRAMLATILHRLAGEPSVSFSPVFSDVSAGTWYANAVIWASNNNIVNGVGGGHFAPNANVTREQFATLLFRYAEFAGLDTSVPATFNLLQYSDRMAISSWAIEPMIWAVYHGLITGTSSTTLTPSGTATRSQCAVILYRFSRLTTTPSEPGEPTEPEDPADPPEPEIPNDPPTSKEPNGTEFELRILELTNAARAEHGLRPLAWHNGLRDVAMAHSVDMWQRGFYSHTNPDGLGVGGRLRAAGIDFGAAGENIARGNRTPEGVFEAWMNSPGHRTHILSPYFTHMGIGHLNHNSGGYNNFWTQKFIQG